MFLPSAFVSSNEYTSRINRQTNRSVSALIVRIRRNKYKRQCMSAIFVVRGLCMQRRIPRTCTRCSFIRDMRFRQSLYNEDLFCRSMQCRLCLRYLNRNIKLNRSIPILIVRRKDSLRHRRSTGINDFCRSLPSKRTCNRLIRHFLSIRSGQVIIFERRHTQRIAIRNIRSVQRCKCNRRCVFLYRHIHHELYRVIVVTVCRRKDDRTRE